MIRIISRPDQPAKAAGEDDDSVLEDESEDESESDSENDSEEAAEAEADAGSEGDEDEAGTCQEDEPVAVSEARIGQTITDGEASTSDQVLFRPHVLEFCYIAQDRNLSFSKILFYSSQSQPMLKGWQLKYCRKMCSSQG